MDRDLEQSIKGLREQFNSIRNFMDAVRTLEFNIDSYSIEEQKVIAKFIQNRNYDGFKLFRMNRRN